MALGLDVSPGAVEVAVPHQERRADESLELLPVEALGTPRTEGAGHRMVLVRQQREAALSLNLALRSGGSGLIPTTRYPASCSVSYLSLKSQASAVHPGVIAAG